MISHVHMLHEMVRPTDVLQLRKADLGNNSAKLAAGSRDSMGSGAVSGGEDLARYHEGRCVGSKILEEIGEAVEHNEAFRSFRCLREPVEAKSWNTQMLAAMFG